MPLFPKEDRLRKTGDFVRARKTGRRVSTEAILISHIKGLCQRFGVVVGSNVGNAVKRNRIKRVFRDFFRLNRELFPVGDCVVVAKPQADKLTNNELRKCLVALLKKIT